MNFLSELYTKLPRQNESKVVEPKGRHKIHTVGYIDVGDDFKMLVTVLTIFVTVSAKIHCIFKLTSGINIEKVLPTSKF